MHARGSRKAILEMINIKLLHISACSVQPIKLENCPSERRVLSLKGDQKKAHNSEKNRVHGAVHYTAEAQIDRWFQPISEA